MADVKLSARAEADLLDIYDYTEGAFGAYQAEAYLAGLECTFDLLANFPRIGATVGDRAELSSFSVSGAYRVLQRGSQR